jgi:hypothetical protein
LKRISIVLLMLLALVAAACTDSQGASPTGAASDAAAESQPAGESEESEGAEESADDGGTGAVPSFELPASAPELAALLPDEINGQEAVKLSMSGEEMMEGSGDESVDPEFLAFLERLGAQPDEVSFAFSFAFDAESGASAGIAAFRVEGANSDQLESEFQATMEAEGEPVEWEDANVAGKDVKTAADPDTEGNTMYLYTVGDVVFFVTAADEATAVELLEPLP